jgi:hypothetical protein
MSAKDLQYIKEAWEGMNSTPDKTAHQAADSDDSLEYVINIDGWAEELADSLGDDSLKYFINNFELVSGTLMEALKDEHQYRTSPRGSTN